MLEILCKALFFLSMLIVYANVTSTSIVIVIIVVYVACVSCYYYFDNIQGAIDEWLNYLNANAGSNDATSPSHLSGYFVSRKYSGKINSANAGAAAAVMSSASGKKIFNALRGSDGGSFAKENNPLESRGSPAMKANGDLPSPIMKNGSTLRSNRVGRDSLKLSLSVRPESGCRMNGQPGFASPTPSRRYNANLDLETFMNVNSPGFTSRVVDKATESASYHIKYPAVRQIPAYRFDKSTLRQLSKIPKANSAPAVRIAPPEPNNVEFLNADSLIDETSVENLRSNDYLQVLRDISRKRNYCQEETDRNVTIPKKSRKNDTKNVTSSHYKRAHEDCSNDSIDDKNYKKRCDDVDRNYAKIMSFTSSMSVLVPEFSWNNSTKKRKSTRLEKSKNESPEKMEKCRKIDEKADEEIIENELEKQTLPSEIDSGPSKKSEEAEMRLVKHTENGNESSDKVDSSFCDSSADNDHEGYIRVASGKILNRTNCTYRKKLSSTKIDPVCVISTEPEYVSNTAYIDDNTMKENLLNSLVNDIERNGEKNDSVIFYQNSIVEEIEKKSAAIEAHEIGSSVLTSSSFNPLLPLMTKPSVNNDKTDGLSASVDQQHQLTVSSSNSTASQQVFDCKVPVQKFDQTSKKSIEESVIIAEVDGNNSAASTLSPGSLPSSILPGTSSSQFNIPTLTKTTHISMCATEASKPNITLSVGRPPSDFTAFDKIESATTVNSNKRDSDNSSVTALSSSAVLLNPLLKLSPKITTNNGVPASSASVPSCSSSLSISTSVNTTSIFDSTRHSGIPTSNVAAASTSCSLFAFNKPVDTASVTSVDFSKPFTPTFSISASVTSPPVSSTITNSNSSSLSTSLFSTTTVSSASSFSAPSSTFSITNSSVQNQATKFNLGSESPSAFKPSNNAVNSSSQTSIFNSGAAPNLPQPYLFGASSSLTGDAQLNVFGAVSQPTQTSTPLPSVFGANTQSASNAASALSQPIPQNSIFGSYSQSPAVTTSGVFASDASAQSSIAVQPSIFGSVGPSQSQSSSQTQVSTLFGSSGDTSTNIFGQSQSTAPPVGVVNPLPQSVPQFGAGNSATSQFASNSPSMRFTFGNTSSQPPVVFGAPQPAASATAGSAIVSATIPFGPSAAPPVFGAVNDGTPAFNFNASPSFGSTPPNSFSTPSNSAVSSSSGMFNFGSSNSQTAQTTFQFGAANSVPVPNQPFMFGGNSAPVTNTGGFSIGTGGSSNRSRPMARPRKAK